MFLCGYCALFGFPWLYMQCRAAMDALADAALGAAAGLLLRVREQVACQPCCESLLCCLQTGVHVHARVYVNVLAVVQVLETR